MKQSNVIFIHTLITLFGSSNAKETSSATRNHGSVLRRNTNKVPSQQYSPKSDMSHRELETTIQGSCKSSTMSPGDLIKANESILCYPSTSSNPVYKFGIDSTNTLSYYVYDTLIWRAVPTVEESTACIVFGNCDSPPMVFLRLQNAGSLVGYDGDTAKIWDSHESIEENGEYLIGGGVFDGDATDATGDKISGSTLYLNEEGVFIETPGEAITWRLFAPDWEAPSTSPINAPSASPVVTTDEPTKNPTPSPVISTTNPTSIPTVSPVKAQSDFVSVSGKVFEEGTDLSPVVSNIVVDLYNCPDSGDPAWIVMTRTNETGHYMLRDDGSSGNDLSSLLHSLNITKFRAVFGGLQSGYAFSPAVSDSDVNSDGMTACWDLEENGYGSIVWNAGLVAVSESTEAPVNQPVATPIPTTKAPTELPSSVATVSAPTSTVGLVGGYAFFDADDNGIRDLDASVEPILTNIDVELFSCGSTASSFNDDTKLAVDKTNAEGMYIFRNLTSGYYRINVIAPEGYVFSSVWSGNQENGELTDPDSDSKVDPDKGSTPCFRVIRGNTDLSWGFGLTNGSSSFPVATPITSSSEKPTSSPLGTTTENATIIISGLVFKDQDENGYFDGTDENTISGVDVALFDCDGAIIVVGSTDENGLYGFDNIEQGSYQVKFSPPAGYEFSSIWSGSVDDQGMLITTDANSDVDPETGVSPCRTYDDPVYSLDAGMFLSNVEVIPTDKPTIDPKGDGTICSGGKCPEEGMCRNVAGVCGSGLSFCNPQSVWTPDCTEEQGTIPSLSPITVIPTVSTEPTASRVPSQQPLVYTVSMCNGDGTYGDTDVNGGGVVEQGVPFTYSLLNESNLSFEDAVALFEQELNLRLACIYFKDSCMNCSGPEKTKKSGSALRSEESNISDVVGLSPRPKDEPNSAEACAFPNYNCRVMNGFMTTYFPSDTPLSKRLSGTNKMLDIIADEMATHDWKGVSVSYNNAPTESNGAKEPEEESDGFPAGATVGIALAAVAVIAAITALIVFVIKDREKKDEQPMQARAIPYGVDSRGSQSFSDDDNSDSDSSSSEDDMSGIISGPSHVSGGEFSYPTTMARANPSDVERDDSSSSSDSYSGSNVDEESGEYDNVEHEASVENLKTSASSDEAPPVYEQDEGSYPDHQDEERIADDQLNFDLQGQYHTDSMRYDQMRDGNDAGSNGSGGSMGSMNSADPPGKSFRDLHQDDDWNNQPPSQSMISGNIIEGGFYADEDSHEVYEHDEASNQSYRSSRSNRSNRSNKSKSRNRSKSRDRNQVSYHSSGFNGEDNDYSDDNYIGEIERQDYTEYEQPQDNQYQNFNHPQFDDGIVPPQYDEQYNQQYDRHYDQQYDYSQYQDRSAEYGDDTTTYSDSTRQVSNVQAPMHEAEQISEANSEPSYEEEEEESISNIFRSLSEIQTKLAKKGKTTSRGKSQNMSSGNSHGAEGLVEDVSVDGSQVSSFEQRAVKNRRPSAGNWMEPVDEDES